jgi:molybdopterin-dependent oxidoreductase alpha subunit
MGRRAPTTDTGDEGLRVSPAKDWSAGIPGVAAALSVATEQMGVVRAAKTLLHTNKPNGFDCPGCAWPDPEHPHLAEFCENGAKAVAEEATTRRITRAFFAAHSIDELAERSDYWLGQQGRLTEPMVLREGSRHYEPIAWDDAFDLIAQNLRALDDPDDAIFYTSGRTSNEAAFVYQLFVRAFGTNNLPDCSNMCHESSGSALGETIGIGKGTVTLADVENADLILIAGQNPGTNHPRMLSSLERAKDNGARIVAINPLVEAGLSNFHNPQRVRGVIGKGTELADEYCQIRLGGDLAFFQAVGALLIDADDAGEDVLDHEFIAQYTSGFDEYRRHVAEIDWDDVHAATGLERAQIERVAQMVAIAKSVVVCWAMGLTQHRQSVPMIREIVNVLLLQGNIGRAGAGACPVRGHSNVQGDRTVGINEHPPAAFLDAIDREFAITAPREHGLDVVNAIRAMRDGQARVFIGMGGNFIRATPDSRVTEAAVRNLDLTVTISTKLNGSHAICGRQSIILPTLGRTERDIAAGGEQVVTVEDSMGMVHASRGRLEPADPDLQSEVAIVCEIAKRTVGAAGTIDWDAMRGDYRRIRGHIERVVPGFDNFEQRIATPGGFALPNGPRDARQFATDDGKAHFTTNPIGISAGRRVVFVNPADLRELGVSDGDRVDLVSEWPTPGGVEERRAHAFRVVSYPTARGCAAAYFPETNVLVPLDATAEVSNTPASKSVVIRLEAAGTGPVPRR